MAKKGKDPLNEIQACLQRRDYKAALPYFLTLLDKNPKNTQIRLRYADTLVLAGSKKESIKQYRIVADELAEAGFMIRAIAINKKIVQLDPTQVEVHEKLASMNEERSRSARPPLVPPTSGPGRPLPLEHPPPKIDVFKTRPRVEPPAPVMPVLSAEDSWRMEFGSESVIEIDLEPPSAPDFGTDDSSPALSEDPLAGQFKAPASTPPSSSLLSETPELELELIPDEDDVATIRSVQRPPKEESIFPFEDETPSSGEVPLGAAGELGPPFDIGDAGGGMEVASHFQGDEDTEPEIDVEPDVVMEEVEPVSGSGVELILNVETEEDESADGANPLVGLLGEDVDSLIDNIISDVSSSSDWSPSRREQAPTRIPLFSDLTTEEFIDVALMLSRRPVKAGTVVVREGEPGESMFIVSQGEVRAVRHDEGEEVELATLKDGDFFGEMAVLTGEPRRATVVAVKNSELLELSRDHLLEIFSRHPHVEAKIRLAHDERMMT